MSCQHKTEGVEGVQAQGGGVGGQNPLAQTLGEQLDTWPPIKSKRAIQREICLLWHYNPPHSIPGPTLEHGAVCK